MAEILALTFSDPIQELMDAIQLLGSERRGHHAALSLSGNLGGDAGGTIR